MCAIDPALIGATLTVTKMGRLIANTCKHGRAKESPRLSMNHPALDEFVFRAWPENSVYRIAPEKTILDLFPLPPLVARIIESARNHAKDGIAPRLKSVKLL